MAFPAGSPDGPVQRGGAEVAAAGVHLGAQADEVGRQRHPVVDGRPVQQRHVDGVTTVDVIALLDQLAAPLQHAVLGVGAGSAGAAERGGGELRQLKIQYSIGELAVLHCL